MPRQSYRGRAKAEEKKLEQLLAILRQSEKFKEFARSWTSPPEVDWMKKTPWCPPEDLQVLVAFLQTPDGKAWAERANFSLCNPSPVQAWPSLGLLSPLFFFAPLRRGELLLRVQTEGPKGKIMASLEQVIDEHRMRQPHELGRKKRGLGAKGLDLEMLAELKRKGLSLWKITWEMFPETRGRYGDEADAKVKYERVRYAVYKKLPRLTP
jgi:hypothetical protein